MLWAQAWKPGSQHAGEKRGVAGLLLGRGSGKFWGPSLPTKPHSALCTTSTAPQLCGLLTPRAMQLLNYGKHSFPPLTQTAQGLGSVVSVVLKL